MTTLQRSARNGAAAVMLLAMGACSSLGSLGNVLGSVLNTGGNQVDGTVRGVDTRNQQISLQSTDGQNVALQFDNQTKVVYQNRTYPVTSLEYGDRVSARVQQTQGGGYYTDSVVVTQPAAGSGSGTSTGSGTVQSLQGTVRQVDRNNGAFTVDTGNNTILTVSLPFNATSSDVNRFNSLRSGDYVRFNGVYLNNSRVELRQFTQ